MMSKSINLKKYDTDNSMIQHVVNDAVIFENFKELNPTYRLNPKGDMLFGWRQSNCVTMNPTYRQNLDFMSFKITTTTKGLKSKLQSNGVCCNPIPTFWIGDVPGHANQDAGIIMVGQ